MKTLAEATSGHFLVLREPCGVSVCISFFFSTKPFSAGHMVCLFFGQNSKPARGHTFSTSRFSSCNRAQAREMTGKGSGEGKRAGPLAPEGLNEFKPQGAHLRVWPRTTKEPPYGWYCCFRFRWKEKPFLLVKMFHRHRCSGAIVAVASGALTKHAPPNIKVHSFPSARQIVGCLTLYDPFQNVPHDVSEVTPLPPPSRRTQVALGCGGTGRRCLRRMTVLIWIVHWEKISRTFVYRSIVSVCTCPTGGHLHHHEAKSRLTFTWSTRLTIRWIASIEHQVRYAIGRAWHAVRVQVFLCATWEGHMPVQ